MLAERADLLDAEIMKALDWRHLEKMVDALIAIGNPEHLDLFGKMDWSRIQSWLKEIIESSPLEKTIELLTIMVTDLYMFRTNSRVLELTWSILLGLPEELQRVLVTQYRQLLHMLFLITGDCGVNLDSPISKLLRPKVVKLY